MLHVDLVEEVVVRVEVLAHVLLVYNGTFYNFISADHRSMVVGQSEPFAAFAGSSNP